MGEGGGCLCFVFVCVFKSCSRKKKEVSEITKAEWMDQRG